MIRNKRIRSFTTWGGFAATIFVLGYFFFKDLTSPLETPPEAIAISSVAPPQTEPPTTKTRLEHSVPALHPRYLHIPKLNINTNIYGVGLERGIIEAPKTAWGVGWYREGGIPGGDTGTALIDGHVNDAFNTPGVFYELSKLTKGDTISITRGDNKELHYRVVQVDEEPLENIDMGKVLRPIEASKEGLNLITCGGKYDRALGTYTSRIVVYSTRAS